MMAAMLILVLTGLLRGVRTHRALVLENLALRHQLGVLQRTAPRPRLRPSDRVTFIVAPRGICASIRQVSLAPLGSRHGSSVDHVFRAGDGRGAG